MAKKQIIIVDTEADDVIMGEIGEGFYMTVKRTMTLNLSSEEMAAVETIARRKDVTKTAIIKQAIRLYLLVDTRLGDGDKLFVEDDEKQKTELAVL